MSTKFRFGASHWKLFTRENLEVIKQERLTRGIIQILKGKEYGKSCPACEKPNNLTVDFCTGCSFPLVPEDTIQLPDNIFLDILQGRSEATILFREEGTAGWNDKFGVSRNHIDVVSEEPILDITTLDANHIPLLQRMYSNGLKELSNRPEVQRLVEILNNECTEQYTVEDLVTSGFNYPVSVKHLHLHMVVPPFKHRKVFGYPRWHSFNKVMNDLKLNGKVSIYENFPNDEEGQAAYDNAIRNHEILCKSLKISPDDVSLDYDPTTKF